VDVDFQTWLSGITDLRRSDIVCKQIHLPIVVR
jgi:hypothetical protein